MRKKKCFWSLIASALFVGCLTSCDDVIPNDSVVENANNNSQGTNNTSEGSTGTNSPNSEGTSNGTNNNSQTVRYSIEDNEITQMVFNEFKKTFSDITYEDFRINGRKSTNSDEVRYSYMSSDIELKNNIFSSKAIRINETSTFSKYINNEWVKTQEYYYIGSQFYITYELEFNDDNTFKLIRECTFDENGNRLTQKITRYINNEWIKTLDSISINGEPITIYSASLNSDNIITSIDEYTIDDEGNYLTCKSSILSNGKWAINEFVYINGKSTFIGSTQLNEDKSYNFKWEYTRDENGNLVASKRFNYINNEWILVTHNVYINGEEKNVYFIAFKDDNTFNSKDETSYDENGNVLTWTETKYINGEWINDFKRECTYDENGNKLTCIDYKYINNDWVKICDIKTINGHMKTMLEINFNANGEYESKCVYTYDENGNELTEIKSKYSNNEWVEVSNCFYINGERKTTYYLSFNQDGTFNSKYEYAYDNSGNTLTSICSKYSNNEWTYYEKYEYTYDANGNKLTEIKSKYSNNDWANESKNEYTYDENNNLLTNFYYIYINDIPTLLDKTIFNYSS
nr:hypothetical protein [Acholeplasmatales bacterium]